MNRELFLKIQRNRLSGTGVARIPPLRPPLAFPPIVFLNLLLLMLMMEGMVDRLSQEMQEEEQISLGMRKHQLSPAMWNPQCLFNLICQTPPVPLDHRRSAMQQGMRTGVLLSLSSHGSCMRAMAVWLRQSSMSVMCRRRCNSSCTMKLLMKLCSGAVACVEVDCSLLQVAKSGWWMSRAQ